MQTGKKERKRAISPFPNTEAKVSGRRVYSATLPKGILAKGCMYLPSDNRRIVVK